MVICGEDDRVDGYRIGTLVHCIPFGASWNFVYVLSTKKNKIFLNTPAGYRLLKCSFLPLYMYLSIFSIKTR